MVFMNLTLMKLHPDYYSLPLQPEVINCHEDIEIMIESFLLDYNTINSKLRLMRGKLQSAEELTRLRLDTARNQLLATNTVMSVMMLAVGSGSFICSMFGMNLYSGVETGSNWFTGVSIGSVLFMLFSATLSIAYLTRKEILPRGMLF